MKDTQTLEVLINEEYSGKRLDVTLAQLFPDYSRSYLQNSIKQGLILVDGRILRARDFVNGGEKVVFTPKEERETKVIPEKIDFDAIYEDNDLLIINKLPNMVVHPAPGNYTGTLLNALLYYHPPLAELPRGGIVHRLDKDTSGVMVVAKNYKTYNYLIDAISKRKVKREYIAIVRRPVTTGGTITVPIGRHPTDRKRMATVENGREAITHYRIAHRFKFHTALDLSLVTGRTHQIRVHMSHIGHPIIGDKTYGGRFQPIAGWSSEGLEQLKCFARQALNAKKLSLVHPSNGETCEWSVPLPDDMQRLWKLLEKEDAL